MYKPSFFREGGEKQKTELGGSVFLFEFELFWF